MLLEHSKIASEISNKSTIGKSPSMQESNQHSSKLTIGQKLRIKRNFKMHKTKIKAKTTHQKLQDAGLGALTGKPQ